MHVYVNIRSACMIHIYYIYYLNEKKRRVDRSLLDKKPIRRESDCGTRHARGK